MFEIKITETRIVDAEKLPEYKLLRELPDGTKEHGYTDPVPCKKQETIERFHQTVDELDIAAVIAVVNNLNKGA